MKIRIATLFILAGWPFLYPQAGYSQSTQSPEGAFDEYQAYLARLKVLQCRSLFRDRIAEQSSDYTNALSEHWKIDLAGKRVWRQTRRLPSPQAAGGETAASALFESLVTPHDVCSVTLESRALASGPQGKEPYIGFTSYLDVPKNSWETKVGLLYLALPLGYFKDGSVYKRIQDVTRGAPRRAVAKAADGGSLVGVSCTTSEMEFVLWLDQEKGYVPKRIEINRVVPCESASHFERTQYSVERFAKVLDLWIPADFHLTQTYPAGAVAVKLPEGVKLAKSTPTQLARRTVAAEVKISDIDLSPLAESDFRIQAPIPNGTKVSMQDAMHLKFVWQDGRIVPVTDKTLEAMRDTRFLGGPTSPRLWAVVLGLVLLGIVLCLEFRKRRKAHAS